MSPVNGGVLIQGTDVNMQNAIDQAVEMYKQGKSLRQIASELQVCRRRVSVRLKELGLTTRCGRQPLTGRPGTTIHDNGYILVHRPDHPAANQKGYVREHRLVMEAHLGRYLTKDEVVHHKNSIVTDNRIENLELFSSHAEHIDHTLHKQWPIELMVKWWNEGLSYTSIAGLIARSAVSTLQNMQAAGCLVESRRKTSKPVSEHHLREAAQLEPTFRGNSVTYAHLYKTLSPRLKVLWKELRLPPYGTEPQQVPVPEHQCVG